MKNKNIKDTFESFSLSEESREKIFNSIVSGDKARGGKAGRGVKWAYMAAACAVLTAAVILLSRGGQLNTALPEPAGTQAYTPDTAQGSDTAQVSDTVFSGFVLTAYRPAGGTEYLSAGFEQNAERLALEPEVKVLLAKYSPAMSSVPGLPFAFGLTQEDINGGINSISVTADKGIINEWDAATGIVSEREQPKSVDTEETVFWSETLYWSPDAGTGQATITVEALKDGIAVGRQEIHITQDNEGNFYATAGKAEEL